MINYYLLTKPKIVLGNLIPLFAGFFLASKGTVDLWLFFETLIGLALVMASACVFNNYIDRQVDKKMKRTENRPLVKALISTRHALFFGTLLGVFGIFILWFFTNVLTVAIAGGGFFVYVVLYSLWKCRTIYGTAIGSVAGAVPPVVGYCAVSHHFDIAALLLFMMLVLWQMPHFFAITLHHFEDYVRAGIPVLPVQKGIWRTKIHMTIYIIGFIITTTLFSFFNYTGNLYLIVSTLTGLLWLFLCLKGFKSDNNQLWGGQMFRFSLLVLTTTCFFISFDIA